MASEHLGAVANETEAYLLAVSAIESSDDALMRGNPLEACVCRQLGRRGMAKLGIDEDRVEMLLLLAQADGMSNWAEM